MFIKLSQNCKNKCCLYAEYLDPELHPVVAAMGTPDSWNIGLFVYLEIACLRPIREEVYAAGWYTSLTEPRLVFDARSRKYLRNA